MSEFQFKNVLSNDNNIFYDIAKQTDYFVNHPIQDAVNLAEYVRTIARYFVQNMNKELSKTFQFEKDILDWLAIDFTSSYVRYVSTSNSSASILDLDTKNETLQSNMEQTTIISLDIEFEVKLNKIPKKILKKFVEVFTQYSEKTEHILITCPSTGNTMQQQVSSKKTKPHHNITVNFNIFKDNVLTVKIMC